MTLHIHGARWWKFDFHNHTPASDDFGKGDSLHKAISPQDWLLMYMRAGIDCVAITDHNSGNWIDILKSTLQTLEATQPEGYRKIFLFPGVEITASSNIHILALFETSVGTAEINALLGAINFPPEKFGTSDATSSKSVEEIIGEVHKRGAIAIPAHVDEACGLFKLTGHTLSQALKVEELLAIEVINSIREKPDLYKQSKLHLAEVIGSDSHVATQVGGQYTWVKMSNPSLEALRLSLHDCEDGIIRKEEISSDPNTISNRYFIKSISVSNGFKAGNGAPLNIKLSPWLTSVIGGRGSGKSTIINYLRIAMDRVKEMPVDVQDEFDKFNQIGKKGVPGMLRDSTRIKVEIFKDGKPHLITWANQTHLLQSWDDISKDWGASSSVSNISELFPIQIFNQKELYSLTNDPSKLIELIDSQFDKRSWQELKDQLIEKWLAERAKRRLLQSAISDEHNLNAELESINNKIQLYESSEYKETLANLNKLTAVNDFFSNTAAKIFQFIREMEDLNGRIPNIAIPVNFANSITGESALFLQTVEMASMEAGKKLAEGIALIAPYKENLQARFNALPWFEEFKTAKESYEAIMDKFHEFGTESYDALIQRRNSLNGKLSLITTQKQQLKTSGAELEQHYISIINHEKELRIKRREIIDRWKQL